MTESNSEKKSIIFAGGGTGGHLLPGIAIAEQFELLSAFRMVFVGSNRSVEQQIIENAGYDHLGLPCSSSSDLRRSPLRFLWNNIRAFSQARRFLRKERPAIVIGLGGFASVPVVIAASRLNIPVVLLEQNMIIGRANQFLLSRSQLICTSFAETIFKKVKASNSGKSHIVFTGNPVREKILRSLKETPDDALEKVLILVLGGSQGATAVNNAVASMLEQYAQLLPRKFHLVHQTGVSDFTSFEAKYQRWKEIYPGIQITVQPFFDDLADWYRRADLVISRSGATTLAELACTACPAVLIPYPNSIGEHQLFNARYYADNGAAVIVEQSQDIAETVKLLGETVIDLLSDRSRLNQMRESMLKVAHPQAAHKVVNEISKLIK